MSKHDTFLGRLSAPWATAYEVVRKMAGRKPGAPAFELIGYKALSYQELLDRADQCAAMLLGRDLRPGDRVTGVANN